MRGEHARARSRSVGARKKTQVMFTSRYVTSASAARPPASPTVASGESARAASARSAQIEAVQPAPDDERPVGAVPQAAEQHRDHQVARRCAPAPWRLPPSGMYR